MASIELLAIYRERTVHPSPEQKDERLAAERRRQAVVLLVLAVAALAFNIWRTGFARVFTPGWWRLW